MSKIILTIIIILILIASSLSYFFLNFSKEETGSSPVSDFIFFITLRYDNGNLEKQDLFVKQGFTPDRKNQPKEGYVLKVMSDKELYSFKFIIPLEIYITENETGRTIILNQTTFVLTLPYFEDAKHIKIYSPSNELKLEIDLNILNCGDGTCESYEDKYTCPSDCFE